MRLPLGGTAPDFDLVGVDGARHTLESYAAAELLVLIQSCNHCPYVIAWTGRMISVQADYAGRGVSLVAVNSNDGTRYPADSYDAMVSRAGAQGLNFDYLHDADQTLARALGAERTPEVFLFDRDRRLVYHGAIDDSREEADASRHYLRDALDAVLAGGTPSPTDTPPMGCTVKWLP
jgi:peroxiredoxin